MWTLVRCTRLLESRIPQRRKKSSTNRLNEVWKAPRTFIGSVYRFDIYICICIRYIRVCRYRTINAMYLSFSTGLCVSTVRVVVTEDFFVCFCGQIIQVEITPSACPARYLRSPWCCLHATTQYCSQQSILWPIFGRYRYIAIHDLPIYHNIDTAP